MTAETAKTTNPAPSTQIDTVGLTQDLTAGPTSPHCAADAERAMSAIGAWKPRLDRRQSWDSQEYKHMQQSAIQAQRDGDKPESGFTEQG